MLLQDEFEIDATVAEAWSLLTDLEGIAPCMPGAALEGRDGDDYIGSVKVKVGPITAHLHGRATFVEKDGEARQAVIEASGKDRSGQANASAVVRARLEPLTATRTRVVIDTELDISGRVAQFGRGAIGDVSRRLLSQFAANLSSQLQSGTEPLHQRMPAEQAPPAGIDAVSLVVPMLRERFGPVLAGGILGFLLSWLAFGRKIRT